MTGYALRQIQRLKDHPDVKPMKGELRDVLEISVHDDSGKRTYRTTCTTKGEVVFVLHAFQKKSASGIGTARHQLDLIKRRRKTACQRSERRHGKA